MFKKYFAILLASSIHFANAQENLSFSTQKKVIQLSTGITMSYVEVGTSQENIVLFLHGYTDTSRSFFPTIEDMHRKNPGLKIFALDLRGHGNSSMPSGKMCEETPEVCFSPTDFSNDVIAFMDKLKIGKAFIVGHSMGSIITQEIALQHPTRVRGAVLIGSAANGRNNSFIHDYLISNVINKFWKSYSETQKGEWPQNVYYTKPISVDSSFTNWVKTDWVVDPTADQTFIAAIYSETMQTSLGTWIGVPKALSLLDNRERLTEMKVPTLVLWATQDGAMPEKPDQDDLKKALAMASQKNKITFTFKVYGKNPLPPSGLQTDDFGHNLQWGAPTEVAADILSFIRTEKPTDQQYFAGWKD